MAGRKDLPQTTLLDIVAAAKASRALSRWQPQASGRVSTWWLPRS